MRRPTFQLISWIFISLLMPMPLHVKAAEFTVHASPVGEYMTKIGPTLEDSDGLMMEIAAEAFGHAGLSVKVAPVVPWTRAQVEAFNEPGGILVVLARTPGREAQWRWLSVIYTDKIYAYTMKDRPVYSSYEDIKKKKARPAVKLGSASESIFKSLGVRVDASPDTDKNFMKLISGRVDVVVVQRLEVAPALQAMSNGRYKDDFQPFLQNLRQTPILDVPLWMVTSLKTPESDAQRLQDALENFKRTQRYRALIKKYEGKLSSNAR